MSSRSKKDKSLWTNDDYYKHYRNQAWLCKGLKYGTTIAPMLVLFIVKWDEYIQVVADSSPYKLTIGCICALIIGCIAVIQDVKHTEDETVKSMVWVGYWWLWFVIALCFANILNDLALVLGCESAGITVSAGMGVLEKNRKKWAASYQQGKVNAETLKNSNKEEKGKKEDKTNPVD